jgi:hypothetical protein
MQEIFDKRMNDGNRGLGSSLFEVGCTCCGCDATRVVFWRFAMGFSIGMFSGTEGCTPSMNSQCASTPTSTGGGGSGVSTSCDEELEGS